MPVRRRRHGVFWKALSWVAGSMAVILLAESCAGGSRESYMIDTDRPLASSHAAVEALSDSAFVAYLKEGLALVAEGDPWGERLLAFVEERGVLADWRTVESTSKDLSGNRFYVTVHPPHSGEGMFYFRLDPRSLHVPRIPMSQSVAGIIFGHELQHAYDAIMTPHVTDIGTTNYAYMELNAYQLTTRLADNYTDGRFQAVLDDILRNKEYKRRGRYVLRPDDRGRRRLDALFGPPSPWEVSHRFPLYQYGLTFAQCTNQVERIYATYEGHRLAGIPLAPPGSEWFARSEHAGIDLDGHPGEVFTSPIDAVVAEVIPFDLPQGILHAVILAGTGSDEGRSVRLLNVDCMLPVGSRLERGGAVGEVEDVGRHFRGLRSHVHVELYVEGRRIEAAQFLSDRLPGCLQVAPAREGYRYTGRKPLEKGFRSEEEREYREAIDHYRSALEEPVWETTNGLILHYIARCRAVLGEFDEAVEAQRSLLRRLTLELAYARGGLPDHDLGPIGAVRREKILSIWIDHQERNLNAYLQGMDTLYVY